MKWLCPQCRKRFDAPGDTCPDDGTPMVEDRAGESVGGCTLDALIGVGRHRSTVWEASRGDEPRVAVKVVTVEDDDEREALQAAARSAAVVRHAHLVSIHGHGSTVDGHVYIVMDLLEGVSLADRLARATPVPADEALSITGQILEALAAAHREGLPHLELEPSDIFIESSAEGPRVTVLDVGLALPEPPPSPLALDDDEPSGALYYRAPELFVTGRGDAGSDLYAVGAILVHLLTGRPAYAGSVADLKRAHLSRRAPLLAERAVDPELAERVQPVVDRLMAKQPTDRYASATEARAAVLALRAATDRPRGVGAVSMPVLEKSAPPAPAGPVRGRATGDRSPPTAPAGPGSGVFGDGPPSGTASVIEPVPPAEQGGGGRWVLVAVIVLLVGVGVYLATRPPAVAPPAPDQGVTAAAVDRGRPPPPRPDAAPPKPVDAGRPVDAAPPVVDAAVDATVDAAGPRPSTVTSTPAGAQVVVDGAELGRTPWTGVLPAGAQVIELVIDGYDPHPLALAPEALARGGVQQDVTLTRATTKADPAAARRWRERQRATQAAEAAQARALEAAKETARRLEAEKGAGQGAAGTARDDEDAPPKTVVEVTPPPEPDRPPKATAAGVLPLDRKDDGGSGQTGRKGRRAITTLGNETPTADDGKDDKKVDLLK